MKKNLAIVLITFAVILSLAALGISIAALTNEHDLISLSDAAEVWYIDTAKVSLALNPTVDEVEMSREEISELENAIAATLVKRASKRKFNGYSYAIAIVSDGKEIALTVYGAEFISLNGELYRSSGRLYHMLNKTFGGE